MTMDSILDEILFADEDAEVVMEEQEKEMGQPPDLGDDPSPTQPPDAKGDHSWRQSLTIKAKLESALSQELYTDLKCLVGQDQEEVKCHSLLLRLHSQPFNQSYLEKCQPEQMTFPNFTPSAFKKFLLFLYTEKFHWSVEETISLLEIGSEFQVESLVQRCSKLLKDQLDIPNCCVIYAKTMELGIKDLNESVYDFVLRNTGDAFKTQGFLALSLLCLQSVLNSSQKNIDQVSAFNAMIRWARQECERNNLELTPFNLRLVLDGCHDLINYELFSAAEFSEHVVDTGVLSETVALQILKKLHLNQQGNSRSTLKLSHWGLSSVSSTSSSAVSDTSSECSSPTDSFQSQLIFRLKRYKSNPAGQSWIPGGIEKITFMSKKQIQISGVGLFGRSELNESGEPLPIKASLTLSTFDGFVQIASARKLFPGSAESRNIDFLFENPVTLEEKRWYTLSVDTSGEVQPTGTWTKKKVKVQLGSGKESLTIRFLNPKGISARTRTGQFPELLFTSLTEASTPL